jgi:hypothetical protein
MAAGIRDHVWELDELLAAIKSPGSQSDRMRPVYRWYTGQKVSNMLVKILAALFFLLLLGQLVTQKAWVQSNRWLRVRLSERPGARVYWGPVWVRRTEDPRLYWGAIICNCVMILVLVFKILRKTY